MFRRITAVVLLAVLVMFLAACHDKRVKNPLAQVDSKQPDKVLFDRALEMMKQRKYDVARLSLQTLINAYPDSEYVARAKLGIGDAWYHEGGSAALAQAENEYKDFITFFPNMPEAAEAQLKVADIHYRAMEKPDRDYTHAKRAEEEYRQLLLQYPDSKLAEMAKKRLLEVQEVLGEREYRIGRFYFLRQSYNASIARLKSLADTYPLYSKADESLFMIGQAFEAQANIVRNAAGLDERKKAQLVKQYEAGATEAYSRIVTRYPAMARYEDARNRLKALDQVVPKPTEEAMAQNKKEQESREEMGRFGGMFGNLQKRPKASMLAASKVGEPTLVDPKPTDAPALTRTATDILTGNPGGEHTVSAEPVKDGTAVPESQPIPRSDDKPSVAPGQVNEASGTTNTASTGTTTKATPVSDSESSSKGKKKKGLRRLMPF